MDGRGHVRLHGLSARTCCNTYGGTHGSMHGCAYYSAHGCDYCSAHGCAYCSAHGCAYWCTDGCAPHSGAHSRTDCRVDSSTTHAGADCCTHGHADRYANTRVGITVTVTASAASTA